MKFYKQELLKGQQVDLTDDKLSRFFLINKITLLNVYLLEVQGVSNPSSLTIKFNIDSKKGLYDEYCLMLSQYRLQFVLENRIYLFDATKIKGLQNLMVNSIFKLRVENENTSEDENISLYCTTDSDLDLGIQNTRYL